MFFHTILFSILFYCILLLHFPSCPLLSCLDRSHPVLSCPISSNLILSYPIPFHPIWSHSILSCPIPSYLVSSDPILPCWVLSYCTWFFRSILFLWFHLILFHSYYPSKNPTSIGVGITRLAWLTDWPSIFTLPLAYRHWSRLILFLRLFRSFIHSPIRFRHWYKVNMS